MASDLFRTPIWVKGSFFAIRVYKIIPRAQISNAGCASSSFSCSTDAWKCIIVFLSEDKNLVLDF